MLALSAEALRGRETALAPARVRADSKVIGIGIMLSAS